jgi:hypothetical protein
MGRHEEWWVDLSRGQRRGLRRCIYTLGSIWRYVDSASGILEALYIVIDLALGNAYVGI